MDNNIEFKSCFNNIEAFLKKSLEISYNIPFYNLVNKMSNKNKIVDNYKTELYTLGDLRNFVTHGDIKKPWAVVSDEALGRIKIIERNLTNPKKIYEVFDKQVITVSREDSLEKVLKIIKEKQFSQFPVLDEGYFNGIVSENGITNWLASNIEEDIISIKESLVKDVMIKEEEQNNYKLMLTSNYLHEVIEAFEKGLKHHRNFIIIVINRKKDQLLLEDIYTIITPWDLSKIYLELGLEI